MGVVNVRDEAKRIEARKIALGLDDARFACAIEDEARRQGRAVPFVAKF